MRKIVNFRPTLFIALSLIVGIVIAQSLIMQRATLAVTFLILFIICNGIFFILSARSKNTSRVIFAIVFLLFAIIGFFSFDISVNAYKNDDFGGHIYAVDGKIISVENYDSYQQIIVDDLSLTGVNGGKCNYKISVTVYNGGNFELGDRVTFTTELKDKTIVYEDRFNASQIQNGIRYSAQLNADDIYILDNDKNIFESINISLKNVLKRGMDSELWPIAYAMLTGTTADMDDVVLEGFRSSGIAHIFAVSGLHIGFLASTLYFILNRLKTKRLLKRFLF